MKNQISRRAALTKSLGVAGALGFGSMMSGTQRVEANDDREDDDRHEIDQELQAALRFKRDNTRNPAAIIDTTKGMLVGFGDNLFHHDLLTLTSRLFTRQQLVVSIANTIKTTGDFEHLALGSKITRIGTIKAVDGRVIISTLTIEPIRGQEGDDNTSTNSTFKTIIEAGVPGDASSLRLETIYNDSVGFFPEGVKVSGTLPPFNPIFYRLMGYASDQVDQTFGRGDFLSPMIGFDTISTVCRGICLAASSACFICRTTFNPLACESCATLTAAWLACSLSGRGLIG
jgi:hypothetical protein